MPSWLIESAQSRLSGLSEAARSRLGPLGERARGRLGWLAEADHGRLGFQLLLMMLGSGLAAMALTLLPPLQHFEHQLYDLRLYFQNPMRPHPDLVLGIIEELKVTQDWAYANRDEYAEIQAEETGLDAAIWKNSQAKVS